MPGRTTRGLLALVSVCGTIAVSLGAPASASVDRTTVEKAADERSATFGSSVSLPAAVPPSITTELVDFPDEVLDSDSPLQVTVVVTNGTAVDLDESRVRIRLTRSPLADADAVDAFIASPAGSLRGVSSRAIGNTVEIESESDDPDADPDAEPTTISRLAAGASTRLTVAVQPEDLKLPEDDWGVYGLVVEIVTPDGMRRIDSGVVTWAGTDVPQLEIAAIATASGPAARVRSVVASAAVPGVALVADPTSLSTVGATEVSLPAQEAFLLPSLNPDIVSLAHAEDQTLLPYALDHAASAMPDSAGTVPWLAVVAELDAPTVAFARANGAAGVMLERAYTESPTTGSPVTPAVAVATAEGEETPVLLPEPVLSAALADADPEDPTSTSEVLAHAALIAGEADAPVLVSPGVAWHAGDSGPSRALEALLNAPFATPTPITALLSSTDAARISVPSRAGGRDDVPVETVEELTEAYEASASLAAVAEDPATILDPAATTLLSPLATRLRIQPETRDARAAFALSEVERTLSSLSVAAGSDVNLIAAKGSVPVTVRNALDVPATIAVDLTSLSPNLQIRDTPTVTIPAGQSQTVLVEVEAVSSANVETVVVLRTPEGDRVGDAATLGVRVRADWGNAVTAVFTAGLVLLLVAGVWRTIRRGRKDTRTGPRPAPEEEKPAEEER